MCQFKSLIILKDRIFVPDYESHTEMLKELNIEDTQRNAENLFVRAELIPPNGDVFSNIDTWEFRVDQDILPAWFVEEYEKERTIKAVKLWAEGHIHIGKQGLCIGSGCHYIKDCKDVVLYGSSTVREMRGSSTVREMYGSSMVQRIRGSSMVHNMYGSSTVQEMCDSSMVQNMYDSSTVQRMRDSSMVQNMYGSSTVQEMRDSSVVQNMYDSSTVQEMCDSSTAVSSEYHNAKKPKALTLLDNSTFKDCKNRIIYQSGDWEFRAVGQATKEG